MSPIYLILLFVLFGLFAALLIHGQAQVKKKVALEEDNAIIERWENEMRAIIERWEHGDRA